MAIGAALLVAALIGMLAYNAGLERGVAQGAQQGIAQAGKVAAAPVPYPYPYPYPYYGGYRPWGVGFLFGPFLFILFVSFIVRGVFGRSAWRRGRCGNSAFDEWHRQAHERFGDPPAGGGATSR
jgi:hypothetical protein